MFDLADKGSIFFDEIGNVPLETQAKLLRVIQERDFMRLGGMETIKVDVRIIAATNVDLRQMMEEGKFREDLFYRLHVISIQLPPLRERKDDIPLLVHHFLEKYGEENRKSGLELTPDALDLLTEYDWPGNVRELENVIERAVVLCDTPKLSAKNLPAGVGPSGRGTLRIPGSTMDEIERHAILSTLEACGGKTAQAAQMLDISVRKIQYKLHEYGVTFQRTTVQKPE
jgi:two-component system response regulator HydG